MAWPSTFPIVGSQLISAFRPDFNAIVVELIQKRNGPDDPEVTYPGMFKEDTTSGWLKRRTTANDAWHNIMELDQLYGGLVHRSGATMTGALNMGSNVISNLAASAASSNGAARMADLDAYAKLSGATFTAIPKGPPQNPTLDDEFARKKYVDDTRGQGGSYTGQIVMTVAPSASQHVMRKVDVEGLINTHNHQGGAAEGPKLESVSVLKSTGQSAGRFLRADGSDGVAWREPGGGSARTEPLVLFTETGPKAWTTVDLSTEISSGVEIASQRRAAIIQLEFKRTAGFTGTISVDLRRGSGDAASSWQATRIDDGETADRYDTVLAYVPLTSSKTFDYQVSASGGANREVKATYLGYV